MNFPKDGRTATCRIPPTAVGEPRHGAVGWHMPDRAGSRREPAARRARERVHLDSRRFRNEWRHGYIGRDIVPVGQLSEAPDLSRSSQQVALNLVATLAL